MPKRGFLLSCPWRTVSSLFLSRSIPSFVAPIVASISFFSWKETWILPLGSPGKRTIHPPYNRVWVKDNYACVSLRFDSTTLYWFGSRLPTSKPTVKPPTLLLWLQPPVHYIRYIKNSNRWSSWDCLSVADSDRTRVRLTLLPPTETSTRINPLELFLCVDLFSSLSFNAQRLRANPNSYKADGKPHHNDMVDWFWIMPKKNYL